MTTTHTVATGDTVDSIAKRYGVTRDLVSGYRSRDANTIFPGEVLNIGAPTPMAPTGTPAPITTPDGKALQAPAGPGAPVTPVPAPVTPAPTAPTAPVASPAAPTAPTTPTPSPTPAPAPAGGQTYAIKSGDTLSAIAAAHGTTVEALAKANGISDPNTIQAGANLTIPGPAATTTPSAPAATATPTPTSNDSQSLEILLQELANSNPELADRFMNTLDLPQDVLTHYGVSTEAVQKGFALNPAATISDLVTQVMAATGLPDVKSEITNISGQIEELANKRDEEIAVIQDNPWMSSTSKDVRIKRITDSYEKKIGNRTDRLTLLHNAYTDARQQAQFAATTAISLYDKNRTFDYNAVNDALDRAEKASEARAKLGELSYSIQDVGGRSVRFAFDKDNNVVSRTDLGQAGKDTGDGSGGGTIKLGAPERQELLGSGFSSPDIVSIEQDVSKHGLTKVLEGITDPAQKAALNKVYGAKEKVTREQIEKTVTQKVAMDGLKDAYTETELKDLADQYGSSSMWTGAGSDITRFLNSADAKKVYVDLLYEQYKSAGMAD